MKPRTRNDSTTPTRDTHQTRQTQVQPREVEPRLPHEHDESADSQRDAAPHNETLGRQAHRDVERGLVDTDRGPVLDRAYNEKVRPPAPRKKLR